MVPHLAVSVETTDAGPDDKRAGEGGEASGHVNDTAAGKVDDTCVQEEVPVRPERRDPAG